MFTDERNKKITSNITPFQVNCWSLPQVVQNQVLLTELNVHTESSGGSRFVTKRFFVLKVVTNNIYFRQQYDFPFKVIVMWLILIQRNTYCQWIEIKESPEYIFYDNIGDSSIRSFWYQSNDTKRNSWVGFCSHCPTNDSPTISTLVYLTVMLQVCWDTA